MNATKISIVLFLISFLSYSQKEDAYFLLDINHKDYVIRAMGTEINNIKDPYKIDIFYLYDRTQYLERKKQVEKDKKELISHCDTHFLNLVDYKWVQDNTWKENNPNILFKDLYFLLKTGKDEYLKFKVVRTIIAR